MVDNDQDVGSEEDQVVKYGGFVPDNESDTAEREAATSKKGTKRAKDEGVECSF